MIDALMILGSLLFYGAIVFGLIRYARTQKRIAAADGQPISGTTLVWRKGLEGIELEDVGFGRSKRWVFAPGRATVGGHITAVVGYRISAQRRGSELSAHFLITVWGIQADDGEVPLMRQQVNTQSPWSPFITAVRDLQPAPSHDPGTKADVPEALRTLTDRAR